MNPTYDVVIAGGGLAGACAALHLSRRRRVLLLEAETPAAGASGVAAGLANPLMGRRARPAWQADAALAALHEAMGLAGYASGFPQGLLRPAAHADQAEAFRAAAEAAPHLAAWLPAEEARTRYPGVVIPAGALWVQAGGALDAAAFVRAMLAAAEGQGAVVRAGARVTGWAETENGAVIDVHAAGGPAERLAARRLLLAVGGGYVHHPELAALHLHRVKGQVVHLDAAPGTLPAGLPPLAGRGYLVAEADRCVVGSSYEHDFTDLQPSPEQTRRILAKATALLPALHGAAVQEVRAGVRVNVPGTRLPMVGPLPGRRHVWVLTGLGSKGLLMAPLLARRLAAFFDAPGTIPAAVRVRAR